METFTQYFIDNWKMFVVIFWIAEKIVKLTPTKYDDILFDILWGAIKKIAGKGKQRQKVFSPTFKISYFFGGGVVNLSKTITKMATAIK